MPHKLTREMGAVSPLAATCTIAAAAGERRSDDAVRNLSMIVVKRFMKLHASSKDTAL